MVGEFLARFREPGWLELPDRFMEPLITLSDIVTRSRSGVARDFQTRDILYLPEPEAPTRLAKQIAQLMAAALAIGVDEPEAWRLAEKVGWDSVPAVRAAVIRLLGRMEGVSLTMAELQEKTGLPETTVRRVVEDLVVLGLATRKKDKSGKWLVAESTLAGDYWDSDRGAA
jgi:DNA-binding MarR family transcriptional regulator